MSGVNAMIPLSFAPTPGLGGDPAAVIREALGLGQLQQQRQDLSAQNQLKQILGQPGAFGPNGVSPEMLSKVAGADPATAIQLQQNQLRSQQQQMQMDLLRSKGFETGVGIISDAYAPLYEAYQTKSKDDPEGAKRELEQQLPEVNKKLISGGGLTPQQQSQLLSTPDPTKLGQVVQGSQIYQNWLTEERRKETAARQERHEAAAENVPVVRPDGKILSYNKVTRQIEPTELPTGAVPLSKVSAPGSAAAVERDVEADVSKEHPEMTPGQRALEAARRKKEATTAPGTTAATNAAIDADIAKEHPDWSPGQRALEVTHRKRESGEAGIGLTPEAIDMEARLWLKSGQPMPSLGFASRRDREAILNRAAAIAAEQGTTVDNIIGGRVKLRSDTQSMGQLEKVRNAAGAFEKGAQKEFDLVLSQIPKTPEPLNSQALTQWTRTGEKQFGDLQVPRYQVALISALDEYAKVLAGNYGIGGSTDASREQALSVIPPGATSKQIPEIVDILKRSMKLKLSGYDDQLREMREDLGSLTPKHDVVAAPEDSSPPQAGAGAGAFPHLTNDEAGHAAYDKLKKGDHFIDSDGNEREKQ